MQPATERSDLPDPAARPDPARSHLMRLERHALVLAVWLPLGFLALALFHRGFAGFGAAWLAAGFGAVLAAFVLHVIVNAVLGTWFNGREVAVGAGAFALAVLALALFSLLSPGFAGSFFLPVAGGLIVLAAAVVIAMVTAFGPRGAFERFDIIRDNNPRDGSRLPHRGGRR
ncbi:hypothetical protein PARHAE_01054 [Paracoccus haematequi]|uniref:Uncharacterized protein n=1 Tax=Paracoccus haematequi TaxID=2491866 RepID=A0A3S4GPP0_9RHOB|nr:hypothetical protein [Paracoccus haematequi]VDS07875.1 hypothetical protein PARHAE_01054 [Paracoccus haematequi]